LNPQLYGGASFSRSNGVISQDSLFSRSNDGSSSFCANFDGEGEFTLQQDVPVPGLVQRLYYGGFARFNVKNVPAGGSRNISVSLELQTPDGAWHSYYFAPFIFSGNGKRSPAFDFALSVSFLVVGIACAELSSQAAFCTRS
jgi:hypothetical protein